MLMGQMIEYPALQGFPRSRVTMHPTDRGFRFKVSYVARGGLLSPLRRALIRLFTAKRSIQELYDSLQKEYRLLESAMNAQRVSEEKYRLLADNIRDVIWTTDFNLAFTYVSPSIESLLGYDPQEFMSLERNTWLPASTRTSIETSIRQFTAGKDLQESVIMEYELIHKNGDTVWVEAVIATQFGSEGKTIGLIGGYRDITEKRQSELERRKLEQQIQQIQKIESIGELAGGVAHDFNNLLTVIQGNSALLQQQASLSSGDRARIQEIDKATERAVGLTRQLLIYGQKQVIEPHLIDLNVLVNGLKSMLDRLIPENIEHIFDSTQSLKKVFVDPGQIEQVITNLCINARDAMPEGGKLTLTAENICLYEADIHLKAKPGDYVVIRVRDTGIGIKPEQRNQIFEPFFTTKAKGKGTGSGLSVVHAIVDQHGGFVHLDTQPGEGTCFSVFLPVAQENTDVQPDQKNVSLTSGSEKLLVVEDDEKVRDIVLGYLKSAGYQTISACNGLQGLELFEQNGPFDLILTDVIMPEMGGVEMMREILKLNCNVPHIFMSGYIGHDLSTEFFQQGQEFIPKPFSGKKLLAKLRSVLDLAISNAMKSEPRRIKTAPTS